MPVKRRFIPRLDARRLDDRPPFLDFSLLIGAKRLRRLLLAREDILRELGCIGPDVIRIACAPDNVDPDTTVLRPTQLPQALAKRFDAGARIGALSRPMSRPTFRTRSPCCARAASGHAATAPPSNVMNSHTSPIAYINRREVVRLGG